MKRERMQLAVDQNAVETETNTYTLVGRLKVNVRCFGFDRVGEPWNCSTRSVLPEIRIPPASGRSRTRDSVGLLFSPLAVRHIYPSLDL